MSELNPCPKCETPNGMKFICKDLKTKKWTVKCLSCGHETTEETSQNKAITAWNRRYTDE